MMAQRHVFRQGGHEWAHGHRIVPSRSPTPWPLVLRLVAGGVMFAAVFAMAALSGVLVP